MLDVVQLESESTLFSFQNYWEEKVMNTIIVGIDLAKNVFAVHGVDENGKAEPVKPKVTTAL